MGLDIDVRKVKAVLLNDAEWHIIADESFMLGSYTFVNSANQDQYASEQVCPIGFQFTETVIEFFEGPAVKTRRISGPLSGVIAVRGPDEEL
jgi:hypothetical protein